MLLQVYSYAVKSKQTKNFKLPHQLSRIVSVLW